MKYLANIPDKRQDKNTTSIQFKKDLIEFFSDKDLETCLEVGTNRGWTTHVLSHLFKSVTTFEYNPKLVEESKKNNQERSNITFLQRDVTQDWNLPRDQYDVVLIDCIHTYENVIQDIGNSIAYRPKYLIFDDYGLPDLLGVNKAINDFADFNKGLVEKFYIGEPKGNEPRVGKPLVDWEGVILKLHYE